MNKYHVTYDIYETRRIVRKANVLSQGDVYNTQKVYIYITQILYKLT